MKKLRKKYFAYFAFKNINGQIGFGNLNTLLNLTGKFNHREVEKELNLDAENGDSQHVVLNYKFIGFTFK